MHADPIDLHLPRCIQQVEVSLGWHLSTAAQTNINALTGHSAACFTVPWQFKLRCFVN